jgi:hypothetical protein
VSIAVHMKMSTTKRDSHMDLRGTMITIVKQTTSLMTMKTIVTHLMSLTSPQEISIESEINPRIRRSLKPERRKPSILTGNSRSI